jgi:lysozyme
MNLIRSLKEHEGYRGMPYLCSAGKRTIGYGCRLPISKAEATLILKYRISKIEKSLIKRLFNVWSDLPKNVREVLIEMAYQMGVVGLFRFKKTIKFIRAKNFRAASIEMIDSQWARRYSMRAFRLSKKMRSIRE